MFQYQKQTNKRKSIQKILTLNLSSFPIDLLFNKTFNHQKIIEN